MRDGISKKIYESVVRRIIAGDFAQGEILTDVGLASLFSTSRTPVREACIHLVNEGFLRRAPGRGYLVTESSLDDLREIYQVRLLIEPPAAELAARASLPPDFFLTCSKLLEQMTRQFADEHTSAERSYERFLELGKAEYGFHCIIARASGNRRLAETIAELMNQYRRFMGVVHRETPPLEFLKEHPEILETIRRHDAPEARRLMHEHILKGSQGVFQLVLDSLSVQEPESEGTFPEPRRA